MEVTHYKTALVEGSRKP